MNSKMPADMLEATRLARTGRLTEATALLQRMLAGKAHGPGPIPERGFGKQADAPDGHASKIIDIVPETVIVTDPQAKPDPGPRHAPEGGNDASVAGAGEQAGPHMPEALRRFLDRINKGGPLMRGPGTGVPGLDGLGMDGWTPLPAQAPETVPEGGRFVAGSYGNQAGSRAYKLYIPSGYHGQPVPLIVMLHGCTQSPDDFAAGTRMNMHAETHTCLVVYPEQSASANVSRCWNWFNAADQQRDRGEPSLIAGITRQVMRDHTVDPERVYVAGLSAGGAAAAVMGMAYPDLYAAIGVHSGLPCGAAADLPSAFAAMRQGKPPATTPHSGFARRPVPAIVFHGDKDTTVHPCNGDHIIAHARTTTSANLRTTMHNGRIPDGHAYSRTLHTDTGGDIVFEQWVIHGASHAWSGGSPAGSYTDPHGPDASREMLRFFLDHPHRAATPGR